MSTIYLSDILRRSGAVKADVRLDARPLILLTFPGGRQERHECALDTRIVLSHEERGFK